jgi:uncharacterized protein (DUF433 family)
VSVQANSKMEVSALSRRRITGRDILGDIRSGMTRAQLMDKYQLSCKQLDHVFEKLLEESWNLAKRIVEDVRCGMSDSDLMEKYQLPKNGLQAAFERLVEGGFIFRDELDRPRSEAIPPPSPCDKRQRRRYVPSFSVRIVDQMNPRHRGRLKDISDQGLGVVGVEVATGEMRSIAVLGDDLGVIDPFEVTAECRWSAKSESGEPIAGFLINNISETDLAWLRRFIRFVDNGG